MREQRLRALAVRLAAVDAAAARHADRDRRGEVAGRAVAQARRLRDDLVGGRIEVVGELDLDDRPQAVGAHADRRRRRCRPRRSARRTRATCRTSPAGLRCSGTRRRSSRRPGRRRRRWGRARASRPSPSAAPGSSSSARHRVSSRASSRSAAASIWRCAQVRGHVLVDVLEHRRSARRCGRRAASRSCSASFCAAVTSASSSFCVCSCSSSDQAPSADQVLLQPRDRVAEREVLPVVGRAGTCDGSSEVECGAGAVGDPLDQRRPEVAARALGGPARGRVAPRGSRCRRRAARRCRSRRRAPRRSSPRRRRSPGRSRSPTGC